MKRRGIEMQDKQDRMMELEQARLAAMPSALPMINPAVVQPGRNGPKAEQILNRQTPLMPWGQQNNTAMQPRMTPAGSMTPLGSRALGGPTMMPSAGSGVSYGGFQNGANPEERIFGASGAEREIANAKQQSMYGGPWSHGGKTLPQMQQPMMPMMQPQPAAPVYVPGTKADPTAKMGEGRGAGVLAPPPNKMSDGRNNMPMIEIPGRATGGPVAAGQPYVVGERGPEIVVPQQSGTVIPNNALPPFSPAAQQLLRQPAGMRKTDWKRYLAKGGAIDLMQMDQQQAQFNQRMQVEDMRYNRARQDELSDREATKAEKLQMERDEDARSMEMIQALGSDQAILSPADVATLGKIKGAKARAAALDVLMQRRAAERDEQRRMDSEMGEWQDVPGNPQYQQLITKTGRVLQTLPKPKTDKPQAGFVDMGGGAGYYADPQGNVIDPSKVMRTENAPGRGVLKDDPGQIVKPMFPRTQRPVDILVPGQGMVSALQDPESGQYVPVTVQGQPAPTTTTTPTPTTTAPATGAVPNDVSSILGRYWNPNKKG